MNCTTDFEKACRFWDKHPCNAGHSFARKNTPWYDREVARRKFTVEPHILSFADFRAWENKTVVDLGCGIGTTALAFLDAGAHPVYAVDASKESIAILTDRMRWHNAQPGALHVWHTACDDARDLYLRHNADLVFCFGVLHHTPRPAALLSRACDMLKDGGEIRLMVYHRWSWKALWALLKYGRRHARAYGTLRGLIQRYSEAQEGCPISRTYTKREISALLESCGFKVESMRVDHIFPYHIAAYKNGALVREWYWDLCPPLLFRALERLFGRHLLVKARKA